jgi:hypothetical protein
MVHILKSHAQKKPQPNLNPAALAGGHTFLASESATPACHE